MQHLNPLTKVRPTIAAADVADGRIRDIEQLGNLGLGKTIEAQKFSDCSHLNNLQFGVWATIFLSCILIVFSQCPFEQMFWIAASPVITRVQDIEIPRISSLEFVGNSVRSVRTAAKCEQSVLLPIECSFPRPTFIHRADLDVVPKSGFFNRGEFGDGGASHGA